MREELKPCPFCGGAPKTSHRPESKSSGGGHVAFIVCYCGGYASTAHQMGHAETVQAAIAEVVGKWNCRAQPAAPEGETELGSDAWMALHLLDRLDVDSDDELRVQQIEEIVRRMGRALSA